MLFRVTNERFVKVLIWKDTQSSRLMFAVDHLILLICVIAGRLSDPELGLFKAGRSYWKVSSKWVGPFIRNT